MSVSNGLSIGHIGLQWGMSGLDGSLMKHVKVFDGSPIRLAGLRWASDSNNIFVKSILWKIKSTGLLLFPIASVRVRIAQSPHIRRIVRRIGNSFNRGNLLHFSRP